MKIVLNGSPYHTTSGTSLLSLLKESQVKTPELVSVELNDAIVDRSEYGSTSLAEGDRVEILYFMGGGGGSH